MKMGGLHSFLHEGSVSVVTQQPDFTLQESCDVREQVLAELALGASVSIIRVVQLIIGNAYASNASDIHIDPRASHTVVRYRIDGLLEDEFELPTAIHAECISRIKILAGLRTDIHHAPQDGRFHVEVDGGIIDVRASIVPTFYGENAVLRILSDKNSLYSLDKLGFTVRNRDKITRALKRPHGLILSTGPTGSGKTTTLYTLINIINNPQISIITIEDPIEYSIANINQIQINPRTGLTFGNGLRSILRQDPNVIMVGEIRDSETAGLAINAALTGHLLLSTVHTNDAPTTPTRLLEMGIEPYLVASTVSLVVAQRLVRRICDECKESVDIEKEQLATFADHVVALVNKETRVLYRGRGCIACKGTGYRGRVGIHEVLEMNDALRAVVMSRSTASEIQTVAVEQGMTLLYLDGLRKAMRGITTLDEVLRMHHE